MTEWNSYCVFETKRQETRISINRAIFKVIDLNKVLTGQVLTWQWILIENHLIKIYVSPN